MSRDYCPDCRLRGQHTFTCPAADPLAALQPAITAARAYDKAHPDSPFKHLLDADTGQLVQVRRDGR